MGGGTACCSATQPGPSAFPAPEASTPSCFSAREDLHVQAGRRVVCLCDPQDPHTALSSVPRLTLSRWGFQSSPAVVFRSLCWSPRVRIWLSVLDAVLLCPASVNASRDLGGSHRPPREKAMEGAEGPGGGWHRDVDSGRFEPHPRRGRRQATGDLFASRFVQQHFAL